MKDFATLFYGWWGGGLKISIIDRFLPPPIRVTNCRFGFQALLKLLNFLEKFDAGGREGGGEGEGEGAMSIVLLQLFYKVVKRQIYMEFAGICIA